MSLASAHIQKYNKTPEGHTEYFIKVFYLGKEWGIRKRYSDFVRFEEYFRSSGYCTMEYSLPPKTWWNKNKKSTLFKRQKELQQYLNLLLTTSNATEISLIREFLEVDENMLAFKKKQSSQEFSTSAHLQDIIEETKDMMILIPCARPTARTRTTSLSMPVAPAKKPSSFSMMSPNSSYSVSNSAAFPRSTSLRGGKWSEALSQAFHTSRDMNNSSEMFGRRKLSNGSDTNSQLLREKFHKRCNKIWQNEKEEVLEILCDFEFPNLTTKSAKVFSNPASILHVLGDPVNGDIFVNDHVVGVVDGIMEAANSLVFELTEDVIEHINTNPRLSRPGSHGRVRMGLSRRPRVDHSPSRAAAQASSGGSPSLSSGHSSSRSFHESGSFGSSGGAGAGAGAGAGSGSFKTSSSRGSNHSSPKFSRAVTMSAADNHHSASSSMNNSAHQLHPRPSSASPSSSSYHGPVAGIAVATAGDVPNGNGAQAGAAGASSSSGGSTPTKFASLRRGKSEGRVRPQEPDFFS